ncbi:MAG: PcfB family protein [bacterium]|nr:PcfB family protein [bacterium]
MQEEIEKKTIALVVSASKMTGRVLQAAIREYLRIRQKHKNNKQIKGYQGKQTIKQLIKSGAALSNIEVTDENIKSFESVAKKYSIDYALKKDSSQEPPKYLVFFKGKDVDVINMAFNEYSKKQLREKPSLRKALSKMRELAKTINPKDRAHRKDRERDI